MYPFKAEASFDGTRQKEISIMDLMCCFFFTSICIDIWLYELLTGDTLSLQGNCRVK
jgi:hypothetical protein